MNKRDGIEHHPRPGTVTAIIPFPNPHKVGACRSRAYSGLNLTVPTYRPVRSSVSICRSLQRLRDKTRPLPIKASGGHPDNQRTPLGKWCFQPGAMVTQSRHKSISNDTFSDRHSFLIESRENAAISQVKVDGRNVKRYIGMVQVPRCPTTLASYVPSTHGKT